VELILDANRNALLSLDLQVIFSYFIPESGDDLDHPGLDHDTWHWYWSPCGWTIWNECESKITIRSPALSKNCAFQLVSQFEQHPGAFYVMSAFATSMAVGVAWAGLRKRVFCHDILSGY